MNVTNTEILDQFAGGERPVSRVTAGRRAFVPPEWVPVFDATTPAEAAQAALALWRDHGQRLMPEFWAEFVDSLVDAWVADRGGEPVLVYVVENIYASDDPEVPDDRVVAIWIGTPATPQLSPRHQALWAAAPPELASFCREVHGSFAVPDEQSFGVRAVAAMPTLAEVFEELDVDPLEYESGPQPDRLLVVTQTYSGARLCLSPELPTGHAVIVRGYDEPDPSSKDFTTLLDELVLIRFEVE